MDQWDVTSGSSDDRGYPESPGMSWDGYPAADPYAAGPRAEGQLETDPYAVGPSPYGSAVGYQGSGYHGYPGAGIAGDPQHPGYPGGLYALMPPTSGMAVTGFILGLLSFILCPGLLAPAGLIFSLLGMRETSARRDIPRRGRGLAIAGLVLSIVCLVLAVLMLVLVVVLGMFSEPS